ncbi:hypothetical protein Lal_00040179 [Lupinus albus]|uniref:Uncharacterized protein n=1 Tax=Lupinus albus TaxID=3870 RepID=A0A6A5N0Y4_LUPAL|nr:hypothetical protein Lalb_Chr02g0157501 [Lupinus albus]KAF1877463.1 hypothetical protein Lal_00040179 [Lupinus albus]
MIHKHTLKLFIVLIMIFSLVLSHAAVPITRSFLSNRNKSSIQATLVEEGGSEIGNGGEMFDVEEELVVKERMDMESGDYPGTGANNRHDPKSPGRD